VTFAESLLERTRTLDTRLCLGLDPRPSAHAETDPARHHGDPEAVARAVEKHALETLEACAPFLCAVKPQVAFYEVLGLPGLGALRRIVATARMMGIPVILDAKRGDIASTAEAYAEAWLGGDNSGNALTVNPYLGFDTLQPFLAVARSNGGTIFTLVKTSNPGSGDLQDLVAGDRRICEHVAAHLAGEAAKDGSGYGAVGAVVGATHPGELASFRALMPGVSILLPGLGAQGAQAADLAGAFDADGLGAVATASRAIHYASRGPDYALAAAEAARDLRDQINSAIGAR
jgi:orotidine-5'-phosphate decarboxylase